MNKLVIGILAHVDAGKTTLAEGMLYSTGAVKKTGRVDHGDAFLDTDSLERERGITIFAKQAVFSLGDIEVTLMDTPGHVDFSSEMERTLATLDYAILVISGTDGVQGYTQTLWKLLEKRGIPVFLFINKMDLPGADRDKILQNLRMKLNDACIDFSGDTHSQAFQENVAMADESLLEHYLSGQEMHVSDICNLISQRKIFPCYFGAALKLDGVQAFLDGLQTYIHIPSYPLEFGARVFKISRDEQGTRLTHLKITGGNLQVRALLEGEKENEEPWQEKVNQIRIYSGAKYRAVEAAEAGTICAVTGLTQTYAGMSLGNQADTEKPMLEPVLTYRINIPPEYDTHTMLANLRQLEEEDPQLHILWNEILSEIHVQIMGEVQLEVLTRVVAERFGVKVSFDTGNIVYKETIAESVIGIGHFEPLRHYAEVHLLLEPAKAGSGLVFSADCSTDVLAESWQRLILTHLAERRHIGVLTGSAITDMRITLITGRAHLKHTEGGDFRQATYRAVRQGLMQTKSVLLEPYYSFDLEIPQESVGRAMHDLQRMGASFGAPDLQGSMTVLTGDAPVSQMRDYWAEVSSYTKGQGRLSCTVKGYLPCHNAQAVIESLRYDADRDLENSADSVFCSHGAGFTVKWDEVAQHAHLDSTMRLKVPSDKQEQVNQRPTSTVGASGLDEELMQIFVKTYGPVKNRGMDAFEQSRKPRVEFDADYMARVRRDDYLLVDGYNIIFAWEELSEIAADDIDAARSALIHILSNYQSVKRCKLILVFDAYKVKGSAGSTETLAGITVVYTKESETADTYIEKTSYQLSRNYRVKVATSDALEQMIILGHGSERVSANELKWEVEQVNQRITDFIKSQNR